MISSPVSEEQIIAMPFPYKALQPHNLRVAINTSYFLAYALKPQFFS
jgi:hypothetical protein